ncbi:MAG: hypothetical protein AB7J13_06305 [Pyrinomonadaceae bacterium]
MPDKKLTFEDMIELSKAVKSVADRVAEYQFEHLNVLTEEEREELFRIESRIREASNTLLNEATRFAWEDVQGALEKIQASTSAMRKTLKKITTFRRAISIAARVLSIAGAIGKADPIGAANATLDLLDQFNEFEKEDEDAKEAEEDALG